MSATINDIFKPFLDHVNLDIKSLQQYPEAASIINHLCKMLEVVRDNLATIHSAIKTNKGISNEDLVGIYIRLNLSVNECYNSIVQEHKEYKKANNIQGEQELDAIIYQELFLSYLDFTEIFHNSLALPYVLCVSFPYSYILFYQYEKQQRMEAQDRRDKKEDP